MSLLDSENVRIIDVQEDQTQRMDTNDMNRLLAVEVEKEKTGTLNKKGEITKPKKYNWAFFLASMFIGIGIGEAIGADSAVLFGMGVGFLFFVDPFYQKVMSKIEKW